MKKAASAVENSDKLWKAAGEFCLEVDAIVSAAKACGNKGVLEVCRLGSQRKVENSGAFSVGRRCVAK